MYRAGYILSSTFGDQRLLTMSECPICFDVREYRVATCGHKVCYRCFSRVYRCPLCRHEPFEEKKLNMCITINKTGAPWTGGFSWIPKPPPFEPIRITVEAYEVAPGTYNITTPPLYLSNGNGPCDKKTKFRLMPDGTVQYFDVIYHAWGFNEPTWIENCPDIHTPIRA